MSHAGAAKRRRTDAQRERRRLQRKRRRAELEQFRVTIRAIFGLHD